MIARDVVDGFFRDNERRGNSMKRPMVWGYFFTDHDRGRLEKARGLLEARGYKFVDILEPTRQDDDQELLFLHVERVEQHTPASLFALCQELREFAATQNLETFDGFDVGNVDGSILY